MPGRSTSCVACIAALALAAGCPAASPVRAPPVEPGGPDGPRSALADDDTYQPPYGKPELQRALIAERGAEASAERRVAELEARAADAAADRAVDDQLRVATADLAVRRRFIAALEACEAAGRWCPPRLDDPPWAFDPDPDGAAEPPMTAPLRFEVASWRALADELHGRACACRTLACVDSVGAAIDQLELRPSREVEGDEEASASITRARECLFRLRGKTKLRRSADPELP